MSSGNSVGNNVTIRERVDHVDRWRSQKVGISLHYLPPTDPKIITQLCLELAVEEVNV